VLSPSDYPLPVSFDAAYKNSTVLVLEADMKKINAPETRRILFKIGMYQGEKKITHFLQPHTVQNLESFLTNRGIPLEQMLKFKAGLLSAALLSIELKRIGQAGTGVDAFYNQKALSEERTIVFLETITEQLTFIAGMGEGREDDLIRYTLEDLNHLPNVLQSMKDAWRKGDNAHLQKLVLKPLKDGFPKIYDSLVVERNNNWIPRIEEILKTKEIELVLVGSLHLAGKDGILTQLKKLGYTIENM
jgi:uncharacterized protein YbaP (TraB family)